VLDPHLVPNAPVCRWSLTGSVLTEYFTGKEITFRILSINDREVVTADSGNTYHANRIPDEQAAREKANW
jgi:hypothetical protein